MSLVRPKNAISQEQTTQQATRRSRLLSWLLTWEIYPILLVTGFLCLYRINTTEFNTDQALIFSMARDAIRYGLLPMTSNASSLGISNPPGVIYILLLPALLSSNPLWAAVQQGLFTTIAALLTYLFARRYYGRLAGIIAALLYGTAASTIHYGRFIWQQNMMSPFVVLFLFALFWGVVERRRGWFAPAVLLLGLLFQLHESTALLVVPLAAAVVLAIKTLRWRDLALACLGLLVIYAPYLLWEVRANFVDVHILLAPAKVHLATSHALLSSQAIDYYRLFLTPYGQQPASTASVINRVYPWISRLRGIMLFLVVCGAATAILLLLQQRAQSGVEHPEEQETAPLTRRGIRRWWTDFRATPATGGLLLLLIWQIVPLIVLSRPTIILQQHYLIFLMPGPFILVGLFIAKVVELLRHYRPQWSALRYGIYALIGLVLLGQFVGSLASVIDISSGNFDDRTFYIHYRNDLNSLQHALSETDHLARQLHLNHVYITTDASTALALRYLSESMQTPTTLFDAANCLVLPNPADGPAALLVGPYDSLTNTLLNRFAAVTLVDKPLRPGGAPFRLYIVTPTPTQASPTAATFGSDLQLLTMQSLHTAHSLWMVTRWNMLRAFQPGLRRLYNYTVTAHPGAAMAVANASNQQALCSFSSIRTGDQLLTAFSLPKGSPALTPVTLGVQSFTTTPYNPFFGPLHFETYIDQNTSPSILHTTGGVATVTISSS